MQKARPTGRLVLVVGASGVGKDTLIAGARAQLEGHPRMRFPRRVVTRASDAHEEVLTTSSAEFESGERAGDFLVAWRAHGHGYAIPATVIDEIARGAIVVCNASRGVPGAVAARGIPVSVVLVTAPTALIAARLERRGRETGSEVGTRLARAGAALPEGLETVEIVNDGTPEDGIARLCGHLLALAGGGS
ncbi:MAG: AAA family ATPase [Rhizobiales bacterium]|nr:AAA family ATPase [Hyphomicrobiales bacterium]